MRQDLDTSLVSIYFVTDLLVLFAGMRFAVLQVKTGLSHKLSHFAVIGVLDIKTRRLVHSYRCLEGNTETSVTINRSRDRNKTEDFHVQQN
jgi:carbamoylphosphate synthase small subunit